MAEEGELAGVLKVLGSEQRLTILRLLAVPRTARELTVAPQVGPGAHRGVMSRPGVMGHVKKLVEVGVVAELAPADDGKALRYVVRRGRLFEVMERARGLGEITSRGADAEETRVAEHRPATKRRKGKQMVLVRGVGEGRAFPLEGSLVIGRGSTARIDLDYDPFVSHEHARVVVDGRHVLIQSSPSGKNGVYVNGGLLDPGAGVRLRSGDIVEVGLSALVFQG